jgi:uncharacterized membrane protein
LCGFPEEIGRIPILVLNQYKLVIYQNIYMLIIIQLYYSLRNNLQIERGKSFMDFRRRSIIKAITWGILSLLTTTIISLIILADWSVSIIIGVLSGLLETLLYYIHERA